MSSLRIWLTYTSVLPNTSGAVPGVVATCVTTAKGSESPPKVPATSLSLEAWRDISSFMIKRALFLVEFFVLCVVAVEFSSRFSIRILRPFYTERLGLGGDWGHV